MSMQDLQPVSQGSLSQVYSSLIPQVAFQITFSSIAASAAQPSQVKLPHLCSVSSYGLPKYCRPFSQHMMTIRHAYPVSAVLHSSTHASQKNEAMCCRWLVVLMLSTSPDSTSLQSLSVLYRWLSSAVQ